MALWGTVDTLAATPAVYTKTTSFDATATSVVILASNTIKLPGHSYLTGDAVVYNDNGGTVITGLTDAATVFVNRVDAEHLLVLELAQVITLLKYLMINTSSILLKRAYRLTVLKDLKLQVGTHTLLKQYQQQYYLLILLLWVLVWLITLLALAIKLY